uniref:Uncharacterized protein n=1 Tax=Acrobeloides nanus TaxID=290746 RepID=A0A914C4T1_9BILA
MPRIGSEWWIYKLSMLTMINFVLQTVYSAVCLQCALFDWYEEIKHGKQIKKAHIPSYWRQTRLHRICDFIYATSAFPVGMATSILFWALYLVEPRLVIQEWVEKLIPPWHNHVTHTAPIAFLLVDTILTCHHMPDFKVGSAVIWSLYMFYLGIIFAVRYFEGFWLYPIFYHLTTEYTILLLTVAGVAFWMLYLIADGLNRMLWGKASHEFGKDPSKLK